MAAEGGRCAGSGVEATKRQGLGLGVPVCSGGKVRLYLSVLGTNEGNWGVTGWQVYQGAEGR